MCVYKIVNKDNKEKKHSIKYIDIIFNKKMGWVLNNRVGLI